VCLLWVYTINPLYLFIIEVLTWLYFLKHSGTYRKTHLDKSAEPNQIVLIKDAIETYRKAPWKTTSMGFIYDTTYLNSNSMAYICHLKMGNFALVRFNFYMKPSQQPCALR